ncbi:MAG: hypothetical protein P8Z00_17090 [Anaerolineales bacterium]|jgi:hypothetical protein
MNAKNSDRRKEHVIVRLYRAVLRCFPRGYRREYTDELLYAIRMAVFATQAQGRLALLRLAWRELRDLPLAILRAHLDERKVQMKLRFGSRLPGGPIRLWQLLLFFLPFLLPLLAPIPAILDIPNVTTVTGGYLFFNLELLLLGFMAVAWKSWRLSRFPVWALPAMGAVLFFAGAILHLMLQNAVWTYVGGGWPDELVQKIWMVLLVQLVFLLVMVGAIVSILRKVPGFRKWVRRDWTMLSFLMYGVAVYPLFGNDAYSRLERYEVASLLILLLGAALYLVAPRRWQRVLLLVIAAILSPAIMSLGLYQVFPMQSWALPGEVSSSARVWEALQPLLYLCPLPIMMLLAALAPHLPWDGGREPATSPAPNMPLNGSQ